MESFIYLRESKMATIEMSFDVGPTFSKSTTDARLVGIIDEFLLSAMSQAEFDSLSNTQKANRFWQETFDFWRQTTQRSYERRKMQEYRQTIEEELGDFVLVEPE